MSAGGSPDARLRSRRKRDPMVRFMEKVSVLSNGCHEWTAHKTKDGYGQFSYQNRPVWAHRWIVEQTRGPIPTGKVIDHLCRNPGCVNPDHLDVVTMSENTLRGILPALRKQKAREQTHCKRGHPLFGPNVFVDQHGHRCCRFCRAMKASEWARRNRARVNELQRIRRAA